MWRYVFALPVLLVMNIAKPSLAAPPRNIALLLVLAGIAFGLDIAFWYAGLLHTSVVNGALLSNLTPVFAALAGMRAGRA
jgi:drug/metabolite transporter (DMT)-like permease